MADIEVGEFNDIQKGDAWKLRARNSDLENLWICKITNQPQNEWESLSRSGYFNSLEWKQPKMLKQFRTENAADVKQNGYDKYFLLNGKKMHIENFNLQDATIKKGTGAELKRIFGKSMKNRLVSRVVLNKFIAEVA